MKTRWDKWEGGGTAVIVTRVLSISHVSHFLQILRTMAATVLLIGTCVLVPFSFVAVAFLAIDAFN